MSHMRRPIGALALGEGIEVGLLPTFLEVSGLLAMTIGVFLLTASEAVQAVQEQAPQPAEVDKT